MKSYTELNKKFFGIKLFDMPEDIGLLPPFFYEYVNVPAETLVNNPIEKLVNNPIEKLVNNPIEKLVNNPIETLVNNPIEKLVNNPIEKVVEKVVEKPVEKPNNKWFDPKQNDTLFWCIFTAVFGVSEYILIGTKYANREWQEKQTAILEFQKSSAPLRSTNHKITLGKVQEIISEYMTNQSSITLLGIVGLSVHYKIQIYLVDGVKKTHLVYTPENYTNTCYIYRHDILKNKFRLALEPVILDDSFCLESFTRPLRAVSSYKTGELLDLAKRFSIEYDGKPKKEDIYRKISEFIVWR
jgi:hypothetical protein